MLIACILFSRLLKYRFNYNPPNDLEQNIESTLKQIDSAVVSSYKDIAQIDLQKDLKLKFKVGVSNTLFLSPSVFTSAFNRIGLSLVPVTSF